MISVLWSSESIVGAKYSMVLTWPPCAAKCRALRPDYKQSEYKTSKHMTGSGHEHLA